MRSVTVIYHCEDGTWWGDSPEPGLESFVAGGGDLEETRRLASEGVAFHLGEPAELTEIFENGELINRGFSPAVILDSPEFAVAPASTSTRPAAVSLTLELAAVQVGADDLVREVDRCNVRGQCRSAASGPWQPVLMAAGN